MKPRSHPFQPTDCFIELDSSSIPLHTPLTQLLLSNQIDFKLKRLANVGQINILLKEKVLKKSEEGDEGNRLELLMKKYEVKYGE
jgi:hypothetical protein